ncbi:hypothetical protein TRFO_27203 [Tritrichomonas foetus]|uniref:Serpin domain-containing protein n=1 Tax=Tritrichomonas foetus TaxID=1144522 RepID=A0A1J4K184_9EUKA|nr:hypothetical protein TRFO_27203 [Tritrichomonas foetus]|eukprot:OHT05185.1 hypothetical protein TRFO_27203 [Tritrichomonas foetus]
MTIPNILCHFAFKIYAAIGRESSENTVYCPYTAFMSSILAASISGSTDLLGYIGFSDDTDMDAVLCELRNLTIDNETLPVTSSTFQTMLENISERQESAFKYLKTNEQSLMYRWIKAQILELFPELLFDDEDSLFLRFQDFYKNNKEDSRISEFLQKIEVPISVLRKAPNVICPNIVWHDNPTNLDKLKHSSDLVGFKIKQVEFPRPAIEQINCEFDELTQGFISHIISDESLEAGSKSVNVNSILFDAKWEHEFESVQVRSFHLYSGEERQVKTMISFMENAMYYENENIQVLQLNYASSPYCMLYILNKNTKIVQISSDELNSAIDLLVETNVYVELPRFETEFGPSSINFCLPNKYSNYLQIIQKVRIGNYEEGTIPSPGTPQKDIENTDQAVFSFICNHPFLFFVRNRETNVIFLMGTITDPIAVDLKPLTNEQQSENFLASIRGEKQPFEPEKIEEDQKDSLWDDIEKIGADAVTPPKLESLHLTPEVPKTPTPRIEDDSDLIEYIYDGQQPTKRKRNKELDFLFGSETKKRVTYPAYSPWSQVIFKKNSQSALNHYEVIKKSKYSKLPPLPPLLELINQKKESQNPAYPSASNKKTPKIVEPKPNPILSLRESTQNRK